ncbi:alpha-(1,3)-fucosyltransferase fut-6-like isoform X2 [Watersipora subatra]|uniref:alpha-(1,3)-fucosyltransferase fut-6-like isoform X2 n=1 Tax=Watersipora subatra TaxID=2589382 RepID=UPI00355B38A2
MAVILLRRRSTVYGLIVAAIITAIIITVYLTSYHVYLPTAKIRIVDPVSAVQVLENNPISGRTVLNASSGSHEAKAARKKEVKGYTEVKYENDLFHGRCYNFPKTKRVTHPLSASEIAQSLGRHFDISKRTLQDITEAVQMNLVSINKSDIDNIKVVLGYHGYEHTPHYTWYNFSHCEYTNCIPLNPHRSIEHPMAPDNVAKAASIILFNLVEMYHGDTLLKIPRRTDQYFGVTSLESTGYSFNLMPPTLNGLMNFTATYSRRSTVPEWHIFKACMDKRTTKLPTRNYSEGKSKGAIAYVSNCMSMQYNRLSLMKMLKSYIPVDIYGGCGKPDPCRGHSDPGQCSRDLHKQYHFYLSFENSLCEDYISEKFWDRLSEATYMLPVAMGGLTVHEYSEQAPNQSFLHVRNFTSIESLGKYLHILMKNPESYNAYHRWREEWDVYKRPIYTRFPSCDLCRIANEQPYMPSDPNLSTKYNDPSLCKNYEPL